MPDEGPVDVLEEGMRLDLLRACFAAQPLLGVALQQGLDAVLQERTPGTGTSLLCVMDLANCNAAVKSCFSRLVT